MRTYETYKDSGLEWLGKVPEHWEAIKIKYLFSFGRGLNITKADLVEEGMPVISYGQIHSKSNTGVSIMDELLRFVPSETASAHPENKVHVGDFIFADTSEDKEGCGNCVYIDREGLYAGYHSLVLDGKGRDNKYFAYLFKSEPWRIQIRSKASGVKVFSITQSILGESTVILPPLSEQHTITSYLDHKVSQIDALIAEKEKMVEDLKAYRSSVITEAVTKGLDKNVEMKESGVEWIGKTPNLWQMSKIGWIYSDLGSGTTPDSNNSLYYEDEGFNWLQTGDLTDGYITSTAKHISQLAVKEKHMRFYPVNSIVVAMYGATIGKVGYLKIETSTNQACCVLPPTEKMSSRYMFYMMQASKDILISKSIGGGQPNISQSIIKEHVIPIPALTEQEEIAFYLDEKIATINSSISEIELQLSDLKSYKSSLITEAVTGKIDLRDWQTQKA